MATPLPREREHAAHNSRDRKLAALHDKKHAKLTRAAHQRDHARGAMRAAEQHRRHIQEAAKQRPRNIRVQEQPRRAPQQVRQRDPRFTEIWIDRR